MPLVEVALSTATARALRLKLGERAVFTPELQDPAVQLVPIRDELPLAIHVAGLFAVDHANDQFWFGDTGLGTPTIRQSQSLDENNVFAQALISDSGYKTMLAATRPLLLNYDSHYVVRPDRLGAQHIGALTVDLAQLQSEFSGATQLDRQVQVALSPVLAQYRKERSQAETLLSVAAIGLFACALACLGLLAALSYDRRRNETELSRTRGASPHHLLAAQAAESFLTSAPAALLGWGLAVLLVDGRGSSLSAWLAFAIVAATVLLPVLAIAGTARRPLGARAREDVVTGRPSARRLAVEGLVAVGAGVGVYLLRRRGLGSNDTGGFDLYLAGVPVLLGLACGILALRLYPLPLAALARVARRGRGLPLHLGLSRAARQPGAASLPLIVLVLALAIATFAAAMARTLAAGQDRSSWRAIGADLRVDAAPDATLPTGLAKKLDAIGDVAPAYVQDAGVGGAHRRPCCSRSTPRLRAPRRRHACSGRAAEVDRSAAADPEPGPRARLQRLPGRRQLPEHSARESISLLATSTSAKDEFPGVPLGTPFAIVSLAAVKNAGGVVAPNRIYLRGASADEVRKLVPAGAAVHSRAAIVHALSASPLASSIKRGFRATIILAAVFAAVALALMALIAARSRARDLALVRTMGGSQREGILLAAVELAPFVVTALVLGIGLGIAIPYLVEPGLDLAFYTGSGSNPIAVPWLAPVLFAVGVAALAVVFVIVAGVRMRRARLDQVLRIGER